jgi:DNA sulfur modification protein DndB
MAINEILFIPALRASMGDWIYYSAILIIRNVAERVFVAEEIHQSKQLKEFIQLELDQSKYSEKIKEYLLY